MNPQSKIRLVVPNSSCGGIIGKGGVIKKYYPRLLYLMLEDILSKFSLHIAIERSTNLNQKKKKKNMTWVEIKTYA